MDLGVGSAYDLADFYWRALTPEPPLTVSEWAGERRVLSRSTSGRPGDWDNSVTPYLVEIMDQLSPSSLTETVVVLAGSQIGKTEVGNNWLGYIVDQAPGPTLMVLPTEKLAENAAKERLKPLFDETPALSGKVEDARKPGSGTTLLRKEFDGGYIKLVSAKSPAQLRSTPARYIFGDEVDAYPESAGSEGDPCELAARAQITFHRRKRLWTSTPTIEGHSKIEQLFQATDQRYYHVPCPHCGHRQRLEWSQLRFDPQLTGEDLRDSVHYECAECSEAIRESQKEEMVAAGEWVATAESVDGKSRGYHLNALYSPFFKWIELVQKFVAAKDSPMLLQVFVNLYLAETWRERAEVPDWNRLYERRESYEIGTVPMGAVFLTAGVDVQGDRFELEVVGWGPGRESWSVDYQVIEGEPKLPETQAKLWKALERSFRHDSGEHLPIRLTAIDSGDQTSMVYELVRGRPRVIAVKGRDAQAQIVSPPTYLSTKSSGKKRRRRGGSKVQMVGSNMAKEELYGWLRLPSPVEGEEALPGFCHFPAYPAEFFKGLTAEELVRKKDRRGFVKREWRKTAERNEPLDCRVYARAAAAEVGLDRWSEARWTRERAEAGLTSGVFAPQARARRQSRDWGSASRFDRWRH
ncbi:MAG: phage terminase large subunit family protein [Planctomycetota bacterium]